MGDQSKGFWIAAVVFGVLGLAIGAFGALWALFFSVGARGGSTADMVAYNLSSPMTAIIAYGPLVLGAALLVAAIGFVIAALLAARRTSSRG